MVAGDNADSPVGSDLPRRFYPGDVAQKLVNDYAGETGIAIVPQREMGHHRNLKKFVLLDQIQNEEVVMISSQELRRKLMRGEDIPTWFSYPEAVNGGKRPLCAHRTLRGITSNKS